MTNSSNIGSATLDVTADLSKLNSGLAKAEGNTKDSVGKMNGLMKGLGVGAAAGAAAVVGVGVAAVGSAKEFDKGMREVNTLIGGDANFLKQLKADTLDLSEELGISTEEIVPALYQAISSGVPPDNVFDFMYDAGKAAIGGSAELADVIAVGTSIAKGYGKEMGEVGSILDELQNVVKLGVTTMPELAGSMGKVVPLASALGVGLDEVNGTMATLTGVTGNTAEVATQMRATFQAILKPTKEMAESIGTVAGELIETGMIMDGDPMVQHFLAIEDAVKNTTKKITDNKKVMYEMSVEQKRYEDLLTTLPKKSEAYAKVKENLRLLKREQKDLKSETKDYEDTLKDQEKSLAEASAGMGSLIVEAVGLESTIGMLSSTAGGNSNTLGKMFGSVEAVNAVLALSGPQAENFSEKLNAMADAEGSVDAAFQEMEGSLDRQYETFKNMLNVALIELGEKLLPLVAHLITDVLRPAFISLTDWWARNEDSIMMFFKTVWEILTPLIEAVAHIFKEILMPAIQEIKQAFEDAFGGKDGGGSQDGVEALKTVVKVLATIFKFTLKVAIEIIVVALKVLIKTIEVLISLPDKVKRAWNGLKRFFKGIFESIKDAIKGYLNLYIKLFNVIIRALNSLDIKIPDWVPGVGGKGFGFDISEIPLLAHGGIVREPILAGLGEAGPEAVIPLSNLDTMGLGGRPVQVIFNDAVYGVNDLDDRVIAAVNRAHRMGVVL